MTKLSKILGYAILAVGAIAAFVAGWNLEGHLQSPKQTLGAAVPTTPALYDGYLTASILSSGTTMTITPSTLLNGSSLSGRMCFVIDVNQPTVEYVCGTASGGTISSMDRGVDVSNPNATSSSLAFSHRRFASVSVSDYPTIQFLVRKVNGTDALDSALLYSSSVSYATTSLSLATAAWVNGAINSASTSVQNSILNTANTFTQAQTFGAGIITSAASTFNAAANGLYSTASSSFVTNGRLNDIVLSGSPNASVSSKGIVQIATALQIASSTATCSSGAPCAISADSATSTYNAATAALHIPVLGNDGKLNPYFIATSSLGIAVSSVNVYTSTTSPITWTKPSGANIVQVITIGAGGGGGGGAGTNSANSGGGGGGGGGAYIQKTFPASLLGSTETVNVGGRGAGGAGAGAGAGTNGSNGGNSTFGVWMKAGGGLGGQAGQGAAHGDGGAGGVGVGPGAIGGTAGTSVGGDAVLGGAGGGGGNQTGKAGGTGYLFGAGGGAGGGGNGSGGVGGSQLSRSTTLTGGALETNGASASASEPTGGAGGGGGSQGGTNGGFGGLYGGGGGGGGQKGAGSAGGTGGNGADGIVIVITW